MKRAWLLFVCCSCGPPSVADRPPTGASAAVPPTPPSPQVAPEQRAWKKTAAAYLDRRSQRWLESPPRAGQRVDCALSCHTTHPYLFSRPLLGDHELLGALRKRVEQRVSFAAEWSEQTPWYGKDGSDKAEESLGSEAVLNAVTLALHDRATGSPATATTLEAVSRMWEAQRADGGFAWLDFGLEPWEAGNETWGAAMAAIAAGHAQASGATVDEAAVARLRGFLRGRTDTTLHDRVTLLWASTFLEGVLTPTARDATMANLTEAQRIDGGWSTASLIRDDAGLDSDGYGTAFATLVLCTAIGTSTVAPDHGAVANGIAWLRAHQGSDGAWATPSANGDSARGARFMTDAATAFATMALTSCTR